MARQQRVKTKYPGVYYVEGRAVADGRPERIYFIRYRKQGKQIEEKAGRAFQDDMTPAKAARIRARRIEQNELSNTERREVERQAKEAEAGRWTIDRLWDEYNRQKSDRKDPATDKSYYTHHLSPPFGNRIPDEIITLDVDRLRIRLGKKYSPQTVKHVLALLKRLIRFGVRKGLCSQPDPAKLHIELPVVHNEKTEDLTPEQIQALLEIADKDPHPYAGAIMKLALFTGLRAGEMFKLRWVDIREGFIFLHDPKGGIPQKVPLPEPARGLLESLPKTGDSPYVFPGRDGQQRTTIRRPVDRIKKAAGLPKDFRPLHGLRHVYASMLASSGKVDMYTLQKLLTHKSPSMTQRYAHLRDEALKRGADVAGEIVEGLAGGG